MRDVQGYPILGVILNSNLTQEYSCEMFKVTPYLILNSNLTQEYSRMRDVQGYPILYIELKSNTGVQ